MIYHNQNIYYYYYCKLLIKVNFLLSIILLRYIGILLNYLAPRLFSELLYRNRKEVKEKQDLI